GDPEASRDPYGFGQGQPGVLGGRGEAGPHPVRAGRRGAGVGSRRARTRHPEAAHQGSLRRAAGAGRGRGLMATANELRDMDDDELDRRLAEAKEELFNLRFQHVTGQLDNYARLGQVKKDVARINTVLREREIEAAEALEGTTNE